MEQKKTEKELNVIMPQHIQGGTFSNVARVHITQREVVIDFAFVEPNTDQAILTSRVILTIDHAVQLKNVMENLLKKYEKDKAGAKAK